MKTVLVTGGAGFIGGNFVHLAIEKRLRVVNFDALTYAGNLDTLNGVMEHEQHHFIQGDIADLKKVAAVLAEYQPDAIVNFAAESHVDRSIDGPAAFVQTNVVGTCNLLQQTLAYWRGLDDIAQREFRFLHVSTDEVYGSLGAEGLFSEEMPYLPNSPYSASKASSDMFVRAYHHTYGLPVLTTNCSNNYGPYQFPEKLVPLVIDKARRGEPIPVYGDGQQIRDWLYVTDHCEAILRVLEAGVSGEVYNVGGNSEKTNLHVIEQICVLLDELIPDPDIPERYQLVSFVKDRPGHDRRYAIDASKIHSNLGWQPTESFESGFRRTVQWYLDNQLWCKRVQDGSYRGERLGHVA